MIWFLVLFAPSAATLAWGVWQARAFRPSRRLDRKIRKLICEETRNG